MTLNPSEEFVVARQLNDPSDSNTYYVRAFVRNAKTDKLIATLDLEDKGTQRFAKVYRVPQDPTGQGLYITITTFVYSDSGYTTFATDYGSEQHELLIQDRFNPMLLGGDSVSYSRIESIVNKALETIHIPEPVKVEQEKFDYETLAKGFEAVISAVQAIRLPETDLRPIQSQLEAIQQEIKAIIIPETDLSETNRLIASSMDNSNEMFEQIVVLQKDFQALLSTHIQKNKQDFEVGVDRLAARIADFQDYLQKLSRLQEKEDKKPDVIKEYLKLR